MLSESEVQDRLDRVRAGDLITITRSNGGRLIATVSGPALAAPEVDQAVGIDLLDGAPHLIRDSYGQVWGQIMALEVEQPGWTVERLIYTLTHPRPASSVELGRIDPSSPAAVMVVCAAISHALQTGPTGPGQQS